MKKIEKLEGSYDVPQLKQKLNEIIDYLNTQPQTEEEECECCKWDDMGYTHEPYCPLFKEYKQDTPEQKEEWEEELGKLMSTWGKVLFVNKGRIGAGMQTAMYLKFYHFIKNLLSEREREVLDTVLSELPERVKEELKIEGHPDPIGRDGFPGDFDGNYKKLYEEVVDRLEIVQTEYANLIYSIKKGLDKLSKKK